MRATHWAEALVVETFQAGLRALPWRASLRAGAALGAVMLAMGVRRAVAARNLERAFPERELGWRQEVLAASYREMGRVAAEYSRLPELARAPDGAIVSGADQLEQIERVLAKGRGAILLTGHFGNFELLGAWLAQKFPVSFVVRRQTNPHVDRWLNRVRQRAGVGVIPLGAGVRGVLAALRRNRCVALVADQDARSRGVFVPFFGRLASTPRGPAELALRTGAGLLMGFAVREADGRHRLTMLPPLPMRRDAPLDQEVERLTAAHTATLEEWIRRHPDHWFWQHRRWKTSPPKGE